MKKELTKAEKEYQAQVLEEMSARGCTKEAILAAYLKMNGLELKKTAL